MADTTGRLDNGPDPLIGRAIGNYVILERLGRGGMGSVYKAEHHLIGKKVAIKVLLKEFATNELLVQRFFNEARAVNKIGHDNIVDISDYGKTDDGWIYYVMELLEGRELTKVIKEVGRLPLPRAMHITRQCAQALAACHSHGIIHRDLKPDNIFLITHGGREDFVKILDFGVAKLADEEGGHTRQGAVLGTPHYMSPEQAEGHPVDERTDIYALGIILYRMLTGKVPFPGKTFSAVIVKVLTEPPPPPRLLVPEVPQPVEQVILKAIHKDPAQRFSSMLEFLEALERAANLDPLAAEVMASPVKVQTVKAPREEPAPTVPAIPTATRRQQQDSWADGLPRLPDDTLSGARTQSGGPSFHPPSVAGASSIPWLLVGILFGVLVALAGGSLALWFLVLKPGSLLPPAQEEPPTREGSASQAIAATPPTSTSAPVEEPPEPTRIVLESEPAGVPIVRVSDGKEVGKTPFTFDPLPTSAEEYKLSAPGYLEKTVTVDPSKVEPIKVTLEKKTWDDKELTAYIKSLQRAEPEDLAQAIDPEAGLAFYQSAGAQRKVFGRGKDFDLSGLEEKVETITRAAITEDNSKVYKKLKSAMSGYDPIAWETIAFWRCEAEDLFCYMGWDGPDGYFYTKAYFAYQNGGMYLVRLLSYTGAITDDW